MINAEQCMNVCNYIRAHKDLGIYSSRTMLELGPYEVYTIVNKDLSLLDVRKHVGIALSQYTRNHLTMEELTEVKRLAEAEL